MGAYTDKLFYNIKHHLIGSGWGCMRYKGEGNGGIHLIMPEGMEMSEPFQQRIWDILEKLPNIDARVERVDISIRKPRWDHYYQTKINPEKRDFETVGWHTGWITKKEWERRLSGEGEKPDHVGSSPAMNDSFSINTDNLRINPELIRQIVGNDNNQDSNESFINDNPNPEKESSKRNRIRMRKI